MTDDWPRQKHLRKECSSKRPHWNEQNEGGIFFEQPFGWYCVADNFTGPQGGPIATKWEPKALSLLIVGVRSDLQERARFIGFGLYLSNPPATSSTQKCPEPKICPKVVPTIVFRGSNQGGPNLSKICPQN